MASVPPAPGGWGAGTDGRWSGRKSWSPRAGFRARKDLLRWPLRGGTRPQKRPQEACRALMAAGHTLQAWSLCARESAWGSALRSGKGRRTREGLCAWAATPHAARRQPLPGVQGTMSGSDKDAHSFHFGKDYLRLAPQKFKQGLTAIWDGQLGGQNGPAGPRGGQGGARAMVPEERSERFRGPGPVTGRSRSKSSCSCWLWSRSPAAPAVALGALNANLMSRTE